MNTARNYRFPERIEAAMAELIGEAIATPGPSTVGRIITSPDGQIIIGAAPEVAKRAASRMVSAGMRTVKTDADKSRSWGDLVWITMRPCPDVPPTPLDLDPALAY